jgi:S-formylglutathione hydrolase FrmB
MGHGVMGRRWRVRSRTAVVLAVLLAAGLLVTRAPRARAAVDERAVGNLETFELPSPLVDTTTPGGRLERERTVPKVHVLLPEGYAEHPDRRYPLIWLLHGANGGTDTWLPGGTPLGGVGKLLAGVDAVVVMPDGGTFGMYVNWWNGGARGGPAWATYHLQLLRQTIEDRYRIRPERSWHTIAGISMGGQGALRYAAMLPGYFGTVLGFSAALPDMQSLEAQHGIGLLAAAGAAPGVDYEGIFGPATAPYATGNSPKAIAENYGHTRMYLTSGWGISCPEDPVDPLHGTYALDVVTEAFLHAEQAPFVNAAEAAGADVTAVTTCGVHTFGVWDRAFAAARAWGWFGEVEEHPQRWAYRTIATSGEMWGLRFEFAAPPSAVARFERSGSTLSGTGTGDVHLTAAGGCDLHVSLPFHRVLPADCLHAM